MVESYQEFAHTKHLDQQDVAAQFQTDAESPSDPSRLASLTSN